MNKLIGEDTANKIINGFNKELEYMNLGPVEGQKILDTEIKPFRSEFSSFLSNFINNRNVTDGVLLESKRNQLERLLNIADPSENIKSKILELQNDIYGDNIKKFSQLFDKSVSEMKNYFGDAGENVTALLKSGKTTNQILDMLTGDEKIKLKGTHEGTSQMVQW